MGTKEMILVFILIPVYISYIVGRFLALPYRINRSFRRKAIRKQFVTTGWLVEKDQMKIKYNYRIGDRLHDVEIHFDIDLNSQPEEIPEKVTIYYLRPQADEILIEELATFDKASYLFGFFINASIPIILYLLGDWLIF